MQRGGLVSVDKSRSKERSTSLQRTPLLEERATAVDCADAFVMLPTHPFAVRWEMFSTFTCDDRRVPFGGFWCAPLHSVLCMAMRHIRR